MKRFLYELRLYLKYRQEINHNYWFSIKYGLGDETYNWRERTDYWLKCQAYDGDEDEEPIR